MRLVMLGPLRDVVHVELRDDAGMPVGCQLAPHQAWLGNRNLTIELTPVPCQHTGWPGMTAIDLARAAEAERQAEALAPERAS